MYFGWGSVQRRQRRQRRRLGCPFHRIALPEHCTCGLVECQSQASGADFCRNRLGTQKSHRHEVRCDFRVQHAEIVQQSPSLCCSFGHMG